jgi:hypothetical protein
MHRAVRVLSRDCGRHNLLVVIATLARLAYNFKEQWIMMLQPGIIGNHDQAFAL